MIYSSGHQANKSCDIIILIYDCQTLKLELKMYYNIFFIAQSTLNLQ